MAARRRIALTIATGQSGTSEHVRFKGDFTVSFGEGWTGDVYFEKSDDAGDTWDLVQHLEEPLDPPMRIVSNPGGAPLWRVRAVAIASGGTFVMAGDVVSIVD